MERYVYKRRNDGIYIINVGKTWEKLQLAARVIVAVENAADIVVQSARPYGQRAILKFAHYTGAKALSGRHTPGESHFLTACTFQADQTDACVSYAARAAAIASKLRQRPGPACGVVYAIYRRIILAAAVASISMASAVAFARYFHQPDPEGLRRAAAAYPDGPPHRPPAHSGALRHPASYILIMENFRVALKNMPCLLTANLVSFRSPATSTSPPLPSATRTARCRTWT